jgi:hypothetical protein
MRRGADVPGYLVRNVDMAGLPDWMYALARQLPRYRGLIGRADGELHSLGDLVPGGGMPNVSRFMVWKVMTWGTMSYADRLSPGPYTALLGRAKGGAALEGPPVHNGKDRLNAPSCD